MNCYDKLKKSDSPGGDLRRVLNQPTEIIANVCNKDAKCRGFNTDGWMKYTILPTTMMNQNYDGSLYVKKKECVDDHIKDVKKILESYNYGGYMALFVVIIIMMLLLLWWFQSMFNYSKYY